MTRAAIALWLLATAAAPAAAEHLPYAVFPDSSALFAAPIADPRHIGLSAAYYRMSGKDTADVALGYSWAVSRWYSRSSYWIYEWSIAGMAYSRFLISGSINSFETVDFDAELPVVIRHDGVSARLSLFHQSSHLGDDYIRATGDQGFRYSMEGLQAQASFEPAGWARVYGGGTYLLHSLPVPSRVVQCGFELTGPDFKFLRGSPARLFLAQDLQSHENARWNVNSHTLAGVDLGLKKSRHHMRFYGGHFEGHSPFGQFFRRRERYSEIGISLHL
jgi:hypothetical protein